MSDTGQSADRESTISGRAVVMAMFAMGIVATSLLYAYWTLHLTPFMPLQEALVSEFPGSAPRVDGGKRNIHKDTPTILRIVMKTQFDPTATDDETDRAITNMQIRVAELAVEKVLMPDLDFIELHIYKLLQEKEIREKSFRLDVKAGIDWQEIDQSSHVDPSRSGQSRFIIPGTRIAHEPLPRVR